LQKPSTLIASDAKKSRIFLFAPDIFFCIGTQQVSRLAGIRSRLVLKQADKQAASTGWGPRFKKGDPAEIYIFLPSHLPFWGESDIFNGADDLKISTHL
jgi:hypothetical protein